MYKNKNTQRGGWGRLHPPGPSLSAGVIDCDVRSQCTFPVACQPDACWQVRSSPPWQLPRGREVVGVAMVLEGREAFVTEQSKREKNSWRGPRPPSSLLLSPLSSAAAAAEGEPRPLHLALVGIVGVVATRWVELPARVSLRLRIRRSVTLHFFRFSTPQKPLRTRMNRFSLHSALLSPFTATFSTTNPPPALPPPRRPPTCAACLTPASPEGASSCAARRLRQVMS